jgi:single-strand DNA-binding protein
MIKLQIIGNLGKDCILKEVNGKNVINFSVAHTEKYKDSQGNPKERTTWVECAYWTDKTAVAQYLTKGRTVYAEGAPEADAYSNKEGQPAATLRMRVQNVQLLGTNSPENNGSNQNSGMSNSSYANQASAAPSPAYSSNPAHAGGTDDMPF